MSANLPNLSRIQIFPVKSLDPVSVAEARVLSSGALEHDRAWGLFDVAGHFVNGKRHAAIHRIRSKANLAARTVNLREESDETCGRTFGIDRDRDEIEAWLGQHFGFPVSIREDREGGFPDDKASPGPTVVSVATLAQIGRWFALSIEQVRARLRANLEIDGVPAFWEDQLFAGAGRVVRFRIGDMVFEGVNPCQRCIVPARDAWTGTLDRTFASKFRELREQSLPSWSPRDRFNHFYRAAVNTRSLRSQENRVVRVGDSIEILGAFDT